MKNSNATTIYAWVGDSPNAVPDRLPVTTCPACLVLVAVAELDGHLKWHRTVLGDDLPGGAR